VNTTVIKYNLVNIIKIIKKFEICLSWKTLLILKKTKIFHILSIFHFHNHIWTLLVHLLPILLFYINTVTFIIHLLNDLYILSNFFKKIKILELSIGRTNKDLLSIAFLLPSSSPHSKNFLSFSVKPMI